MLALVSYNMTVAAVDGKRRKVRRKVDWAGGSETGTHSVPYGGTVKNE